MIPPPKRKHPDSTHNYHLCACVYRWLFATEVQSTRHTLPSNIPATPASPGTHPAHPLHGRQTRSPLTRRFSQSCDLHLPWSCSTDWIVGNPYEAPAGVKLSKAPHGDHTSPRTPDQPHMESGDTQLIHTRPNAFQELTTGNKITQVLGAPTTRRLALHRVAIFTDMA